MKKIYLFCAAGMSTSLLVNRMNDVAVEEGYVSKVEAFPMSDISKRGKEADLILLGPQVRFNLDRVREMYPDIPVETVDTQAYGLMDGKKVLDQARELLKDK